MSQIFMFFINLEKKNKLKISLEIDFVVLGLSLRTLSHHSNNRKPKGEGATREQQKNN
jgi:hypothetical protein